MELTIDEIKILLNNLSSNINPISSLSQKLMDEVKRLEKKREREEKEVRYAEIIINELKKKYPEQLKNIFYRREEEYCLEIVIEDHDLYYSKEFTEFIDKLDQDILAPNEVYGIAFIVDYDSL